MGMNGRGAAFKIAISGLLGAFLVSSVWAKPQDTKRSDDGDEFVLPFEVDNLVYKINLSGYAKAELSRSQDDHNHLALVGSHCRSSCRVKQWREGDTLHLWNNGFCGDYHWKVKMRKLTEISINNRGYVYAGNLQNAYPLSLEVHNYGSAYLCGKFDIYNINHHSVGKIYLRGVNSPVLSITSAGKGDITIRGKSEALTTYLSGRASLDASDLRSDTLYALLKDGATMWTDIKDVLFVRASDNSSLFYTSYPATKIINKGGNAFVGYKKKSCAPTKASTAACAKTKSQTK